MLNTDLEITLLLISSIVFIGYLVWIISKSLYKKPATGIQKNNLKIQDPVKKSDPVISVFEKFDYLGTKIYNNDGKYTVVEDNVSRNFNSINELPLRYQKMILEMQTQKFSGRKDNYYMENKNGSYTVVFPDGNKKKYKTYQNIPENIRKIMGGQ